MKSVQKAPTSRGFAVHSLAALLSCLLGAPAVSAAAPQTSAQNPAPAPKTTTASQSPGYSSARAAQRRSQLARARVAARARELQEAAVPRFKMEPDGTVVPDVRAEAAIVYNPATGQVLWGENTDVQRSIASITKLMTAIVFIEARPDLAEAVTITRLDVRAASTTYLRYNDRLTKGELLHLLLIGSDNAAARVLARVSPWGSYGFVGRMNEKADELGLEHTEFTDPSGLDAGNVSSAYDLSRLIVYAAANETLAPIMTKPDHTAIMGRRVVKVTNTNKLLGSELDVRGGKTGFIRKSGYCLATLLQLPQGHQVAVVVLGARSSVSRFMETRHIMSWLSTKAQELFLPDTSPFLPATSQFLPDTSQPPQP